MSSKGDMARLYT